MHPANTILLLGALALEAASMPSDPGSMQIVGGQPGKMEDFPYIVSLYTSGHFCGGSIISPRFVVTAAHCTMRGSPSQYSIWVGSAEHRSGQKYQVTAIHNHPKFYERAMDYDVSLLEFGSDIEFGPTAKLISVTNKTEPTPKESVVSGWGNTKEGGSPASTLMYVKIPTIANSDCATVYKGITDRMVCVGVPEGSKDSCQGDSRPTEPLRP
ncbi:hypothetical protein VHEMI08799 [[Torrubiella] hemipterigena]|uniref:Peptidase S1 domain-containing protein n=1 Tax=[Torrubiella] hemipterigena TaxID=1531966 RepID=A0A0A1TNX1_9HYPO|nr:hypothetical protein VHEMI08799 [[Torrubiella] hemipterigena]